jgi:Flp pilus assembly pilin Flp
MIGVPKKLACDLWREQAGMTTAEYGVMLALLIVASLVVLALFRDAILRLFETCTDAVGIGGD